jgi:hypothetical protein
MATPRERYSDRKGKARKAGIPFTLTFADWWKFEKDRKPGWVIAQIVNKDGFVPGNVQLIHRSKNFRNTMNALNGDRD